MTNSKGFTIAELLVAALFVMIVLATLYGFYREQLFALLSQETKTATLEDARGALDMMVRELRNAGSWNSGAQPVGCQRLVTATATAIRIQADLNGDGDCDSATSAETGEDVSYELSGATSTCPGTIIRRKGSAIDPGQCLVGNVAIPSGRDFLTYYSAGSTTPLAHPVSDLSVVRRVKITFGVEVTNPNPNVRDANPTVSTILSSSVELRN